MKNINIDGAIRENLRVYMGREPEDTARTVPAQSLMEAYGGEIAAMGGAGSAFEQAGSLTENSSGIFSLDAFPAPTHTGRIAGISTEIEAVAYPEIAESPAITGGNALEAYSERMERESRMFPQYMRQG